MKKPRPSFPLFLLAVMAIFIGILVYTWMQAARARPVILDERGQVRR
jgi:hypothetical protein